MNINTKTIADALRAAATVIETADAVEPQDTPIDETKKTVDEAAEAKTMGAVDAEKKTIADETASESTSAQTENFDERLKKAIALLKGGK